MHPECDGVLKKLSFKYQVLMVKIKRENLQLWYSFLSVLLIHQQGKAASCWKGWRCSCHGTKSLARQYSSTTYTSYSTLTYISTLVTSRVSASPVRSADYRQHRSVYYYLISVQCCLSCYAMWTAQGPRIIATSFHDSILHEKILLRSPVHWLTQYLSIASSPLQTSRFVYPCT